MRKTQWIPVLVLSSLGMAAAVLPAAAAPPTAGFYASCVPHRWCAVDAEQSTDDGYITNYHWNWGDGTSTNGTRSDPSHIYAVAGNYTITLTITDNDNETDDYSLLVFAPN